MGYTGITTLITKNLPVILFFLIIANVAWTIVMLYVKSSLKDIKISVKDIRDNMLWPDTFEEFKKRLEERFKAIENNIDDRFKNVEDRISRTESRINGIKK